MSTPQSVYFPALSAGRLLGLGLAGFALLMLAGYLAPKWLVSLATLALANGLVSLGILVMMRSGVVPFGQGLVFAAGGYAAALAFNHLGLRGCLYAAGAGQRGIERGQALVQVHRVHFGQQLTGGHGVAHVHRHAQHAGGSGGAHQPAAAGLHRADAKHRWLD